MARITGTNARNILRGTRSSDTILGRGGNDDLYGSSGNDALDGGAGNDKLFGGDGNDKLMGGLGNDRLSGGNGNDVLTGGAGADVLSGGAGIDWASYSDSSGVILDLTTGGTFGDALGDTFSGVENVRGGIGKNGITGNSLSNTLLGGGNSDTLVGGLGADTLVGNSDSDHLSPDAGAGAGDGAADIVNGGDGRDTVSYFGLTADVTVDLEAGISAGAAAGDTYISIENAEGGDGNDTLSVWFNGTAKGNAGQDQLSGDTLGQTRETLTGGTGIDKFVLHLGSTTRHAADVVMDFAIFEQLVISRADFGLDPAFTLAAANIVNASGSIVGNAAIPQFIFEQLTQTLYFDLDGTVSTVAPLAIAELRDYGLNLVSANFELIA